AGWTKKPAMPAARYAWLPVLVVSATHIVPYGLAYSVKNVRSERTRAKETTRGIRAIQLRPASAQRWSPALSGPVTMSPPPSARARWLGLMSPSTPVSIPNITCHSMSAMPAKKKHERADDGEPVASRQGARRRGTPTSVADERDHQRDCTR